MSPHLERSLTEAEVEYVNNVTFFSAHAIAYKGRLDIEAMKVAYRALADHYPVLRAQVEDRSGETVLCAPEGRYPVFVATEGDWDTLLREVEAYSEVRKGDVSSLHVIYNDAGGYVLLGQDHLLVAAGAAWTFYSELWQLYTDVVTGKDIDSHKGKELPEPGDKVTPVAPSKALGDGVSYEDSLYLKKSGSNQSALVENLDGSKKRQKQAFIEVDLECFHRLKRACRSHGIGLGSYFGSVMATVLRDRNAAQGKMPVNFLVAIDHAAGGVKFTDVTVSHVRHRIQVDVDLDDDPFQISSQLDKKIEQARLDMVYFDDFKPGAQDVHLNGYGKLDLSHPSNLNLDFDVTRVVRYGKPKKLQPVANNDDATQVSQTKPFVNVSSITYNGQLKVKVSLSRVDAPQSESICDDFMCRLTSTA